MRITPVKRAAILLAALGMTPLVSHAKDYPINLDFAYQVGDAYRVSAQGAITNLYIATTIAAAPQTRGKVVNWKFEADATIKQVSDRSLPTVVEFVVQEFHTESAGNRTELLAEGSRMTATVADGQKTFMSNGEPLPDEGSKLLVPLVDLDDGEKTNQEAFGTDIARKPGDEWPANKSALIEGAKKQGLDIKPEDVNAVARLAKVQTVEEKEMMVIQSTASIANIVPPVPAGVKVDSANMKFDVLVSLPVDASRPAYSEAVNVQRRVDTVSPNNDGSKLSIVEIRRHLKVVSNFKRK